MTWIGFNQLMMSCCGWLVVHANGMLKGENFLSVGFSMSLLHVIHSDIDMQNNYTCVRKVKIHHV
jgi:hypothetical protein